MSKRIVFFEARGGSDKGTDGHRKDTMPMVEALRKRGFTAEAWFYNDEDCENIFELAHKNFDAYVSRINPGTLQNGDAKYLDMLRRLSLSGLKGFPHPNTMQNFGSKDSLVKLASTELVPSDTYAYYNIAAFRSNFPISLSHGDRVLKQNRGSTGQGIWRIEALSQATPGSGLPLDTKIRCTEAVDNHVEEHSLGDFLTFCERYLTGDNPQLVDMRFLPRIIEGEIRILLVGHRPIFIVHKKPAQKAGAFSATLFSGATYSYTEPAKWPALIDFFTKHLKLLKKRLDCHELPLLWTADFILDTTPDGTDSYVLGEINCSCVGFTSDLDKGIEDLVAEHIIKTLC